MFEFAFAGVAASATPTPCELSGALGAVGAGPTVTGTSRTISYGWNNDGALRLQSVAMTGTVDFEYSKGGGAFTAITDPTNLTFSNGEALQLRIRNATSGEQASCDILDVATGAVIQQPTVAVP